MAFNIACICCTRTVSKPNHINYDSSYQFTNTKLRSTLFLKCTYYQSCTIGLLIDSRLNFISGGRGEERNRKKTRSINIGRGDGDKTRVLKQKKGGGKKKLAGILFEKKYYECYDWKWIRSI